MRKTTIYYKKQKFKDPVLIVGLPGIGNVGSLVAEHLKNELNAERFATLYSPHFLHQAIMLKSGKLRLVSNRFYHSKAKGNTIILLLGDTQAGSPEGQYEVNEKIVRFVKKLGVKTIYTIGGYSVGNQYVHTPHVFGIANNDQTKDYLAKHGVIFGKAQGAIWGSAGLIVALSKKYKISAACIMGETGFLEIDANAAKAVIGVIKDIFKLDINLDNIEKIKKETEKVMGELERAAKEQEFGPAPPRENMPYIR